MKNGKIAEQILKRSVLKQIKTKRPEVIGGAGLGEDCSFLKLEEGEIFVCTMDPVTAAPDGGVSLAVHTAVNNLAGSGAEPVAALVSLLLPTEFEEEELRKLMQDLDQITQGLNMQIAGGHTEVTSAVNQPILTITGIGKAKEAEVQFTSNVQPGQDLVVTKWAGLSGTSVIAKEHEKELKKRFPSAMIDQAKEYEQYLSVLPEARIAAGFGVYAMHDVSQGGIFGALWEMAESSRVGLEVDIRRIPVKQESIELCEYFNLNPYVLSGTGALLICTFDGPGLVSLLERNHIFGAVIGRTTDNNDRVLINGSERRFLERPQPDEIYKLK